MSEINEPADLAYEDSDVPWASPDDMQYDRAEEVMHDSFKNLSRKSFRDLLQAKARDKLGSPNTRIEPVGMCGGYNAIYGLALNDSPAKHLLRIPNAVVVFPDEKTTAECAVAQFLHENTSVPVAAVLHHGLSYQNPEIGPYIIMERIEHFWSMSARLNKRYKEPGAPHVLDTDTSRETLKALDVQMARYLLQILSHRFSRIGSLTLTCPNTYVVQTRPLSMNMQQIVQLSNIPESALPAKGKTYGTADEWYIECSRINAAPLLFQQNNLFCAADDLRNKYVARTIFHRLAKEGKLSQFGFAEDAWSAQSSEFRAEARTLCPAPSGSGEFVLWCDDLRPDNVLLNKAGDVAGVIDWEFAYIAPTQFSLDPPWWLCLDTPHNYDDGGLERFTEIYDNRVKTWLDAVQDVEKEPEFRCLGLPQGISLSRYMRESWETGRFWLSYVMRRAWAFDIIYWKCLDERFFGKRPNDVCREQLWATRLNLLTDQERDFMEPFVQRRMEETKERKLIDRWDPKEVQRRFGEVLGED